MKTMSRSMVRLLIVVALLLAAGAAYGWWYSQVAEATDRAAALATEIQEMRLDSERARDARAELEAIAGDEATIRAHRIATQDVVPFLETLESTGASFGSDIEVVSVAAQQTPQPHLALQLRITGGFDAVVRTLGAIEYAPYDIELRNLALDTAGENASSTVWALSTSVLISTTP